MNFSISIPDALSTISVVASLVFLAIAVVQSQKELSSEKIYNLGFKAGESFAAKYKTSRDMVAAEIRIEKRCISNPWSEGYIDALLQALNITPSEFESLQGYLT